MGKNCKWRECRCNCEGGTSDFGLFISINAKGSPYCRNCGHLQSLTEKEREAVMKRMREKFNKSGGDFIDK